MKLSSNAKSPDTLTALSPRPSHVKSKSVPMDRKKGCLQLAPSLRTPRKIPAGHSRNLGHCHKRTIEGSQSSREHTSATQLRWERRQAIWMDKR
jgi:hypothetical protein